MLYPCKKAMVSFIYDITRYPRNGMNLLVVSVVVQLLSISNDNNQFWAH